MEWRTTKPDKPGWYWWRWPSQPQYGPEILQITQPDGPDTDTLAVDKPPFDWALDDYITEEGPVEWQGPLEPTDPGDPGEEGG